MEQLKSSIVGLLKRSWPLNHEEYHQVTVSLIPTHRRRRIRRSIQLINVARLTGCHELLPPAFFELANSDCTTWTSEVDGAELLCSADWLRMMKGKALWIKRFNSLISAGLWHEPEGGPTAHVWRSCQRDSIFQIRGQFSTCVYYNTHNEYARYCMTAFECLKSWVGTCLLGGESILLNCKAWTSQTFFEDGNVCEGCAQWMNSLIRDKETEVWENMTEDFDLPEVNKDEYRTTLNWLF